MSNVVVFTCGELGLLAAREIARLDGVRRVTVFRTPYRTIERAGLQRIRHVLRYNGILGAARAALGLGSRNDPDSSGTVQPVSAPLDGIDVLTFDDFHDTACIAALEALDPDLGVVAGTYILKPSVFSVPRLGSVNLHTGKAPEYRGSSPGFWEMYNGETKVGITVHWVAAEIDAGAILRQELFPFDNAPPGDPLAYIRRYRQEVLMPNGLRLLVETVRDIVNGTHAALIQDNTNARTYRIPTHRQKQELRRRVRNRRSLGWKRHLKLTGGWLLFRSGMYRRLMRGKAVVVLFHRVDDRYPRNPISCSTAQFEKYCRFFARWFDVIGMDELLDLIETKGDLSRKVVITFDDGYADNVAAAAVMKKHGLTGCFYIATDFMGTERTGWWDAEQGQRSYWMTWDDVRTLHEEGFEIGAHTRNHVDLGAVSGAEAVTEIVGSKQEIESRLGAPVRHFAFPYGTRRHITPDNLQVIRDAGFRSCVSAYGGFVTRETDPFNVFRYAVSPWHRSVWQFALEMVLEPPGTRETRRLLPRRRMEPAGV